jgi:hypothetical protein
MRYENVVEARKLALEFAEKSKRLLMATTDKSGMIWGSKLSGDLRRTSMDLTRMLAEMRKP